MCANADNDAQAPWWTIHDASIRRALQDVEAGTPAEVAYVELLAGVERETVPDLEKMEKDPVQRAIAQCEGAIAAAVVNEESRKAGVEHSAGGCVHVDAVRAILQDLQGPGRDG